MVNLETPKSAHFEGGRHSTEVAFALLTPLAQVRFSAPDIFNRKIFLLRFNDGRTAKLFVDSAEA